MTVYDHDHFPDYAKGYNDDLVCTASIMRLPCGGIAYYDENSGINFRCADCMAVVGSVAQPQHCRDEAAKWDMWEKMGGQAWDYFADPEEWE